MKIFLVEDSPHIRERLRELLESDGNHVVLGCADTRDAAIAGIVASRPDVGIFDIQLKDGSGIEALAESKRLVPELIGIVLTNKLNPQYTVASTNAGASYVLDKSVDFERILEILAVWCKP